MLQVLHRWEQFPNSRVVIGLSPEMGMDQFAEVHGFRGGHLWYIHRDVRVLGTARDGSGVDGRTIRLINNLVPLHAPAIMNPGSLRVYTAP